MLTEEQAVERAEAYNRQYSLFGPQNWRGMRFPRGWLLHRVGEAVERWPGTFCLVVLDDYRVFLESMAEPLEMVAARYEALQHGSRMVASPMDEAVAVARAADFAGRTMAFLGPRRWRAERFEGGWLLGPEGEDLRWNFSLPAVVVFDDGRAFRSSASAPAMFVIERFMAHLAREAAQEPMTRG